MPPPPPPTSSSSSSPNVLLLLFLLFTACLILTSLPITAQNTHLSQGQYMPAGYKIGYQGRYTFLMRHDCNADFSDNTLPNPLWQRYINYNGSQERCRLEIRPNCDIVVLSDYGGAVLWRSGTQQAVDTGCFIEVTEQLILYKVDEDNDRTMVWVNGNTVGMANLTAADPPQSLLS